MVDTKGVINDAEKSEARQKTPIDWEKIAIKFGIVISFLTIIGFLLTIAWNIVTLGEKVGILEGEMQIVLNHKK